MNNNSIIQPKKYTALPLRILKSYAPKPEYVLRPVETADGQEGHPRYHLYKWMSGRYERLPFVDHVRNVYEQKMGKPLNLDNPRSFNEKIQWLKVYDQRPEQITCCDKLAVRDWVKNALGEDISVPVLQVGETFSDLKYTAPCAVKATHDSGSTRIIRSRYDWWRARRKVGKRLSRNYGLDTGQWNYAFVKKAVIVEQIISDNTDYKFHCCHGDIKFVQIIEGRDKTYPLEWTLGGDGKTLGLHVYHMNRRAITTRYPPSNYKTMLSVAAILSSSYSYCRVDLYCNRDSTFFGEITFHPISGYMKTEDNNDLGELIPLSLQTRSPIVH